MTDTVPAAATRPSAAPGSLNTRLLGGLLLVFGSGWMLKETGVWDVPWTAIVSIVLIALGLALVVTARARARTVPLVVLGAVLTAGLAVGSADIGFEGGIGERSYTPSAIERPRYNLGIGDLTLDLRETALEPGDNRIRVNVTIGQLTVRVPKGVEMRVDVQSRVGSAKVLGRDLDIHGKGDERFETGNYDNAETRLYLDLRVGMGQIEVRE